MAGKKKGKEEDAARKAAERAARKAANKKVADILHGHARSEKKEKGDPGK